MNEKHFNRHRIGVGLFVLGFAALMAWQTMLIPAGGAYAQVGPTFVPWIVTAMIAILGAVIIVQAATGWWTVESDHGALRTRALVWVGIALFLNLVLISTLGFILASTAMFVCAARAFGSSRPLRDGAIGFALAFIAYVSFDRGLDYRIGDGLIENLI